MRAVVISEHLSSQYLGGSVPHDIVEYVIHVIFTSLGGYPLLIKLRLEV